MNDRTQRKLSARANSKTVVTCRARHAAKAGGIVPPSSERSFGRLRQLTFSMLLATAMMLAGVLSVEALADELHSEATTNTYCPVTTSELAEEEIYVDWEGQRIHFCCTKCKRDFLANPEQFRDDLISVTTAPVSDKMAHYAEESASVAAGHGSVDGSNQHDHDHAATEPSNSVAGQGNPDQHTQIDGEEHDHATDHGRESGLIAFFGKFHPLIIHFPIALVIMSAVFLASWLTLKNDIFAPMSAITMYWAALFAVIAAVLGLARSAGAEFPSFLTDYFEWHRLLGLIATGITVLSAALGYRWRSSGTRRSAMAYGISLAANVIAIGITGHLGATLVYGPDYFGQ